MGLDTDKTSFLEEAFQEMGIKTLEDLKKNMKDLRAGFIDMK